MNKMPKVGDMVYLEKLEPDTDYYTEYHHILNNKIYEVVEVKDEIFLCKVPMELKIDMVKEDFEPEYGYVEIPHLLILSLDSGDNYKILPNTKLAKTLYT